MLPFRPCSFAPDDFAKETGYHYYEPKVGLGVFNVLVCLITQFLLELRETYPAGLLTWGGVVVVSIPTTLLSTIVAGRRGARGPVRYPTVLGLLYQLFGVSVMFPMVFNPAYFLGGAPFGVPVTGLRASAGALFTLPIFLLTYLVFSAPTDGHLWTVSAGVLGGPILAMMALTLWADKSPNVEPTPESIAASSRLVQRGYSLLALVGFVFWSCLVSVAYREYGFALGALWRDIWTEAGPSVAFMTVDTGVLYAGVLLFIAYQSESRALKALALTPLVGPGAACCVAMRELEQDAARELMRSEKKDV